MAPATNIKERLLVAMSRRSIKSVRFFTHMQVDISLIFISLLLRIVPGVSINSAGNMAYNGNIVEP